MIFSVLRVVNIIPKIYIIIKTNRIVNKLCNICYILDDVTYKLMNYIVSSPNTLVEKGKFSYNGQFLVLKKQYFNIFILYVLAYFWNKYFLKN